MGRFRVIVVTRMNSVSILGRINSEYVYIEIHVVRSLGAGYFFGILFRNTELSITQSCKNVKIIYFYFKLN